MGRGGFGKVYRYEQPLTGRQLAIKVEVKVATYVLEHATFNIFSFFVVCGEMNFILIIIASTD